MLRDINENLISARISGVLKVGGLAMVVTGADTSNEAGVEEEPFLDPGPAMLTREQLVRPLEAAGLQLLSLTLSRFNATEYYSSKAEKPPRCWIAIFKKIVPTGQ